MFRSTLFLCLAVQACATSAPQAPVSAPVIEAQSNADWQLVWSDEFEADQIDETKWSHAVDCWGGGNEERQCYTKRSENSFVADGVLNIVARLEPAAGPALPASMRNQLPENERNETKEQPFTSAKLTTEGLADWLYGRIEIRAKLPEGQGLWPAFWMLPSDETYGAWAASGEIDIVEAVNLGTQCDRCDGGVENQVIGTIHYGAEWPHNRYIGKETKLPPSEDGFHTFAVEWQEGQIDWFVDGQKYSTLESSAWRSKTLFSKLPPHAPFDQPFYLIMNVAIGGHLAEDHNEGGVTLEGFPRRMQVDWVRVYQQDRGQGSSVQ